MTGHDAPPMVFTLLYVIWCPCSVASPPALTWQEMMWVCSLCRRSVSAGDLAVGMMNVGGLN